METQFKKPISITELKDRFARGERDFRNSDFDSETFENLILDEIDFENSWFHSSKFRDCMLKNSNLKN